MSTDKHGNSRAPHLYIFQAKNYPVDFSAIFVVFNLPEVNMIGSRVTVEAPRERKQLEAFGFSFPSLSLPPATNFFVTSVPEPSCDSRLPERKRKRLLRRLVICHVFMHCFGSFLFQAMSLSSFLVSKYLLSRDKIWN